MCIRINLIKFRSFHVGIYVYSIMEQLQPDVSIADFLSSGIREVHKIAIIISTVTHE